MEAKLEWEGNVEEAVDMMEVREGQLVKRRGGIDKVAALARATS